MTDKLIIPEIGYVLGKVEATPGTAEALTTAEAIYVEEMTFSYSMDNISRRPVSPGRQGSMSRAGKKRVEWTASTEMAMPDAFAVASKVPHPDVLLKSCGFARQDVSDAAFEGAFYVLQASNHSSATLQAFTFTADGADANVGSARGARSDFSISVNPDDGRIMLGLSGGRALEHATPATTYTNSTGASRAVTYYADKPFLAHSMFAAIVNLSDDSVYGGGSIAGPDNTLQVVNLTINGAMSPTEQTGIAASSGVARQRLAPADPVTMSLTLEEARIGSTGAFDPYALRDAEQALEIRLKSNQNDISGNTNELSIHAYAQIVGVSRTAANGRALWDLELELRYPEDAADGDPPVGVSPTQVFKAGTNTGLFHAATLTSDGVLCIAFVKS
jgi:hypothetical protein